MQSPPDGGGAGGRDFDYGEFLKRPWTICRLICIVSIMFKVVTFPILIGTFSCS